MRKRTTTPPEAATTQEAGPVPPSQAGAPTDTPANTSSPQSRQRRQPPKSSGKTGTGRGKGADTGETARLIEALLKSRGAKGASQADLEQVAGWAQGIPAEGAAIEAAAADLRKLGPRGKPATGATGTRQKQQRQERLKALEERRQRHALDQALLAGVLSGTISLDVTDGRLVFLHAESAAEHAQEAQAP
jgi:hypothetical protein